MVSAGVCFGRKGRLHFVDEKAKVDALYYVSRLLPQLIEDCKQLKPAGFIFQQDGAAAHTARVTQEWQHGNYPEIIEKDRWPPNSPDLNSLDYHVWGHAGKASQTAAEAKDDPRAENRFAINMGRHATRADQHSISWRLQSGSRNYFSAGFNGHQRCRIFTKCIHELHPLCLSRLFSSQLRSKRVAISSISRRMPLTSPT